jgi:signal transduction histidine kinase
VTRAKPKSTHRIFGSVFTKLLAVILLTGLGIQMAVGVFFWYFRSEAGREYSQTLAHYLTLVVSEIGNPPDFDKAAALAAAGTFHLRYTDPERSWSTAENVPQTLPERRRAAWRPQPGVAAVFSRGRVLVEFQQAPGKFIFEIGPGWADLEFARPVILLLILVSLILAGAYFSLRRILKPIAWLKQGVLEVGHGNLDHRVPLQRADEFRDLAQAFNEMTERIREMLHARERLMLDLSHELRSPLTRLKVALEFLPDDPARDSIRQDVAEMEALAGAILENARIRYQQGELQREPMDLAPLAQDALKEFENQPPGVRTVALPSGIVCRIHPELIRTVMRNLLANAVRHSPAGSRPIEVRLEKQLPFAVVRITDHGVGIAPEDLPRIFDPFFRADPSRSRLSGGYGLGLSLCQTIAEAHAGKIEVQSEPGRGSTFSFFMPLAT